MTDQATEPRQAFSARVPIPVWEEMERVRVEHYGENRTALVEDALRSHLDLPVAEQGPEAGQLVGDDSASSSVQAPPRLLVDVVAERTRLPKALATRMIVRGSVSVGGDVCTTPGLDVASVPGLEIVLNGEPV